MVLWLSAPNFSCEHTPSCSMRTSKDTGAYGRFAIPPEGRLQMENPGLCHTPKAFGVRSQMEEDCCVVIIIHMWLTQQCLKLCKIFARLFSQKCVNLY